MATSQCCNNPPTLDATSGKGTVVDNFGGLKTYVAGSFDASKPAIILLSDIFGFDAPNPRALADKVAESGFYVVIPDFFYGDPMPPNDISQLPAWMQKHGPEKGYEDAKLVIQALKEKGVSAIGAAGFCWGAKVVVELAKSGDIKAGVLLHPAFVTVDDMKEVKVPISILGAEIDIVTPQEVVKQYEEILSGRPELQSFVKIFPGAEHGWTVRYEVTDKAAVEKANEAHKDMLDWFTKYVK
ncbi:alpha/beta-Hydrolases superfamily protein [Rhynchospora pubera]|uniref:Alpha/beta-Hydrolases superfamily protein n=1 Tax=Rhynchospora pubera TaxID=906938 RepID=A0AAV8FGW5_9POAL|nr:alpha/beta-Hydrolases superfamily protein [Rhynchospora pubera]